MIRILLALAALSALSYPAEAAAPPPLRGVPLRGTTGLRLLVANNPPYVVDVDTGRVARIKGLAIRGRAVINVRRVGGHAVFWVDDAQGTAVPQASLFVLPPGARVAKRVATGWEAAGSADRRGLWVKAYVTARRCVLREVDFRGRSRRPARTVSCTARLVDVGRAVVVTGSAVADPGTRSVLLRGSGIWAIAGPYALSTSTSPRQLVVTDLRDGASWPMPWPSGIGGRDDFAIQPNGTRLALSFGDPAYEGSGTQVMDVWSLDITTRLLEHVADMPSAVSLKSTSLALTADQRLVILAESRGRRLIAVWRGAQERLAVRTLRLPAQNAGSDSFIVW